MARTGTAGSTRAPRLPAYRHRNCPRSTDVQSPPGFLSQSGLRMTGAFARALMSLAASCFGETRHEWGLAMQAEFEAANEDRKPLRFAAGCLIAAWREMPHHAHGRLILANY